MHEAAYSFNGKSPYLSYLYVILGLVDGSQIYVNIRSFESIDVLKLLCNFLINNPTYLGVSQPKILIFGQNPFALQFLHINSLI